MGSQFAAVPLSIFNDERLNALDVVVYAALDSFVNSAGEAWPSLRAVAERGKVSPATVKRSIQRLQSAGYIFREQRRTTEKKEFDSTLYKLSFRGKVGSVRAKVGSVRVGGLALTELGVGSDRASNHTHITIPNEPLPPTPQKGGPHPPAGEFSEPPSPSEGSLSETASLTSAETKTRDKPPKAKDRGRGGRPAGDDTAKKAHYDKIDEGFLDFWETYPKKDSEAGARREWRKLFPFGRDDVEYRTTLDRVGERLSEMLARFDEGALEPRFVPKAQNWLKDEDWSHD